MVGGGGGGGGLQSRRDYGVSGAKCCCTVDHERLPLQDLQGVDWGICKGGFCRVDVGAWEGEWGRGVEQGGRGV